MAKDPFDMIMTAEREEIEALDEAGLNARIAAVAKNAAALEEAKELDVDFQNKKEAASDAGAVYRDGAKANKQRIKYMRRMLKDKGKNSGTAAVASEALQAAVEEFKDAIPEGTTVKVSGSTDSEPLDFGPDGTLVKG